MRRQEGIKLEPAEVDERIEAVARENGFPVDDYRKFVDSGDGTERERIEYDLLERRTYDFLLSRAAIEAEQFEDAMAALASLRAPIDAFFDGVMVNDPDPAKRAFRLGLLARFRDAVSQVADFSKIEG